MTKSLSLLFLLLTLNALLVPAYSYAHAKQQATAKAQNSTPGEQAPDDDVRLSEAVPFDAVVNAGLQLDTAQPYCLAPLQALLLPARVPLILESPAQLRRAKPLVYFQRLFKTSIVAKAP